MPKTQRPPVRSPKKPRLPPEPHCKKCKSTRIAVLPYRWLSVGGIIASVVLMQTDHYFWALAALSVGAWFGSCGWVYCPNCGTIASPEGIETDDDHDESTKTSTPLIFLAAWIWLLRTAAMVLFVSYFFIHGIWHDWALAMTAFLAGAALWLLSYLFEKWRDRLSG